MTAPLILVDPPREPFWPLSATRPVAALLAGTRTFAARWADEHGPLAALVADDEVARCGWGDVTPPPARWDAGEVGLRVALAGWVPPEAWTFGEDPAEYRLDGAPVAWRLDAEARRALDLGPGPAAVRRGLAELDHPACPVEGLVCDSIWRVMAANPDLVERDARAFRGADRVTGADPVTVLGDDVRFGPDVALDPFTLLDARAGPIVLDRGVRVRGHAVLRGPLYVGPEGSVLGGEVGAGTSLGPRCKVRGEVEQSIFQGFVNKAHDGFVGHSVLGEWVNLGAGTVVSDLKNTYGEVRVGAPDGREPTGLLKVGAFLGDHVKTGIGTLLATGARIGAASHVFGARGVTPAWLPDFSWHDGVERRLVRLDDFLDAASSAMARRGRTPEDAEWTLLAALHAAAPPD